VKQDWDALLASRFTTQQLEDVIDFLRATNEVTRRHMERLAGESPISRR